MDYTTFSDLRCLNIAYRKVTLSWVVFLLDFSGAFIVTKVLFLLFQANSKEEEGVERGLFLIRGGRSDRA